MANNSTQTIIISQVDIRVERARNRIEKLHNRLQRKHGWRGVQEKLGLPNVSYAYDFVKHGTIPTNPDIRKKLGLLKNMERKKRKPLQPLTAWQKWWRGLTKNQRNKFIKWLWSRDE